MEWLSRLVDWLVILFEDHRKQTRWNREGQLRDIAVRQLALDDLSFTRALFETRMQRHADQVWQALRDGAPERVRGTLSDGLYQSLVAQRDIGLPFEHVACGRLPCELFVVDRIHRGEVFDTVIARPRWYRHGGERTDSWAVSAKWFYVRRRGAAGHGARDALWESCCPSCSAPLELSDRVRCEHCDSVVNSGSFDWILCAISEGEHQYEVFNVPGLPALRAKDPGFTPEVVEDRVAHLFWLLRRDEALGRLRALRGHLADPDASFPMPLAGSDRRAFLEDARLRAALPARDGEALDRLHVRVRWVSRARDGELQRHRDRWVLSRAADALTPTERGLNSLGCQSCGAPLPAPQHCEHCGAEQRSSAEWALESIEPAGPDGAGRAMVQAFEDQPMACTIAMYRSLAWLNNANLRRSDQWLLRTSRCWRLGKHSWWRLRNRGTLDLVGSLPEERRRATFRLGLHLLVHADELQDDIDEAVRRFGTELGVADQEISRSLDDLRSVHARQQEAVAWREAQTAEAERREKSLEGLS